LQNYENSSYLTRVVSVDVSDPTTPVIADVFDLPGDRSWGVGQLANINTQSSWMAHHGNHLALLLQDPDKYVDAPQIHVLDLSDPAAISVAAVLERPDGEAQGQLAVLSDTIVSWHTEPVEGQPGKVRFYFDRMNLEGTPAWEPKVNVPGIIVAYDAEAGRAYTIDFSLSTVQSSDIDCFNNPKYWDYQWPVNENQLGTCTLIERSLEQLAINGSQASLIESHDIEGSYGLEQLYASDSRIIARLDASWWEEGVDFYQEHIDSKLLLIDISADEPVIVQHGSEQFGNWWWLDTITGTRAIIHGSWDDLTLIDAADVNDPSIKTSSLPGWGGCYNPVIDGDTVYCPMGPYGLERVEW
ncbi:MAG: hypothetical protein KC431_29610, partial [Myxococcales bacterium]|nr:hypothetical protein [Myxococcales bacterium]